jgi:hypothetical protein
MRWSSSSRRKWSWCRFCESPFRTKSFRTNAVRTELWWKCNSANTYAQYL